MEIISYKKIMKHNPTQLSFTSNSLGQHIAFYEHPFQGDEGYIVGVINKVAFSTGFYETDDFGLLSEYNPVLLDNGSVVSQSDFDKRLLKQGKTNHASSTLAF